MAQKSTKNRKQESSDAFQQFASALDRFNAALAYGFTDDGFTEAAVAYKTIERWAPPALRELLGNLWRDLYTASPDEVPAIKDEIYAVCDMIYSTAG